VAKLTFSKEGEKMLPWFVWLIAGLVLGYLIRGFVKQS
jgi:hypothetical protein